MDEESVLEFLTSLEAMDLPDRIEEVNARILEKIVQETDYVAVLFCKYRIKKNFFFLIHQYTQHDYTIFAKALYPDPCGCFRSRYKYMFPSWCQ